MDQRTNELLDFYNNQTETPFTNQIDFDSSAFKDFNQTSGINPKRLMPLSYGGRRVGYQDLLLVIEAEKNGVFINLD
jgi:hypothetical protein